ncbi:ComEC/Rec2 family competence protein [Nitratireductor kimnyeongensis]|uniref:ComEC/Rec2 family competence protein n=1 Tax=Nitratireductor kimnyeongensis TaxID=430679 RepID=A0ABW0T2A3_9HYPH|nr:ComEC/Rec2 family competence protein [Nitratireductor kimnyeongensis]QZZ35437.1 ComEC family competence protein [Nitratireductor kimnyeongensis]
MGDELAVPETDERAQFAVGMQAPEAQVEAKVIEMGQARASHTLIAARKLGLPTPLWHAWNTRTRAALSQEAARGTLFLWLPVLLGAGALGYFALPVEPPAYAVVSGLFALSFMAFLASGKPFLRVAILATLIVLLGLTCAKIESWRAATPMLGAEVTTRLTGRVASIEARADGRLRLTVDLISTERPQLRYAPARARLSARSIPEGLRPGDGIQGLVRLMPPSGPIRPRAYDFSFESYFDGLGAVGFFMKGPERVEIDQSYGTWRSSLSALQRLREHLAERLRSRVGGAEGEVAAALITGMRGGIPEEYNEHLRRAGLAHVLAISGLHMALAAFTIIGAARLGFAFFPGFSSRHPVRKYAAAVALLVCFFYLLVSGGGVAAQRSFLMLAIMLLALLFDRAALTMRNLAFAALIVIVTAPHEVVGPGFQMSFSATAALIAGYAVWNAHRIKRLSRKPYAERKGAAKFAHLIIVSICGIALTSLIAGTATTLYGVWHFQRASPLALGANLAAMPVASVVVMPSAVAAIATMPLNLDGWPLALMGGGISAVMGIARWFSEHSPIDATGAIPLSATLCLTAALAILTTTTTSLRLASLPLLAMGLLLISARNLPDIFISEDARLVAVRTSDGALAVNRNRPNAFALENWLRAAGTETVLKPEGLSGAATAEVFARATTPRFRCNEAFCVLRHQHGAIIVHVMKSEAPPSRRLLDELCGAADLIIINDARIDGPCGLGRARTITAQDLARGGSAEISIASTAQERPPFHIAFAVSEPFRPWHQQRQYSRAARGLGPYKRSPKTSKD